YFAGEGDFASAGSARIRLADKLPQGQASISAGQHGYVRGVVADSFAAGPGTLLVGLEVNRNNGPWDVPERVRKYSGVLRYSQGTPDDGFSVTGMAYKNSWNATDQVPLRAVESGQIGRFGSLAPSDGGDTSRYSLSYAMRKRTENRLFELDAYVIRSQLELNSDFTYFLADQQQGDQFQQSERRTVAGLNASESWTTQLFGLPLRNKLGVQARVDRL
ncbi:MAG: TonB-dependent receptor, partial [Janthinobacterium sp.]